MAGAPDILLIHSRMALGLTQQEFGDILGRTKRTVQRWEDRGTTLIPSEVEALARALLPVRPDLAAQIAASADTTLDRLGIVPAGAASPMATSDPTDSVVRAAADAMGVTPDAIRPAIAAAFVRAREVGLDVQTVAERLNPRRTP
jgi:transcriptional regulator with XRE-family HTH domain